MHWFFHASRVHHENVEWNVAGLRNCTKITLKHRNHLWMAQSAFLFSWISKFRSNLLRKCNAYFLRFECSVLCYAELWLYSDNLSFTMVPIYAEKFEQCYWSVYIDVILKFSMNDVNNRNIHLQHKWMQTQFALSEHLLIKSKAISDRNHSRFSKFKQQFQGEKMITQISRLEFNQCL